MRFLTTKENSTFSKSMDCTRNKRRCVPFAIFFTAREIDLNDPRFLKKFLHITTDCKKKKRMCEKITFYHVNTGKQYET